MRLILSSRDFRGEQSCACILRNLPRPIAECRVLFIPNEKATAESIASGRYHSRLAEFGFARAKAFFVWVACRSHENGSLGGAGKTI